MTCTVIDENIDIGSTVRLYATIKTECELTDVGVIRLKVVPPRTSLPITPTIDHLKWGEYFADVVIDRPGQWKYRWESDGPSGAEEGTFIVRSSRVI